MRVEDHNKCLMCWGDGEPKLDGILTDECPLCGGSGLRHAVPVSSEIEMVRALVRGLRFMRDTEHGGHALEAIDLQLLQLVVNQRAAEGM